MSKQELEKPKMQVLVTKNIFENSDLITKSRDVPVAERMGDEPYRYYDPPFEPKDLVALMSISITHARCVKAKAADAAGIGFKVVHIDPAKEPDPAVEKRIKDWARHLHKEFDLNDILDELVKDRESIGWGCIEVIRNKKGEVAKLSPMPSASIRVLIEPKDEPGAAKYIQLSDTKSGVYFQDFPDKYKDGEPQFVSASDEKEDNSVPTFENSANEIIFWRKPHTSATKYYGIPDIIPASGDVAAVRQIRDHFLAFFDNSCIPSHVIVIKGAEATPGLLQKITAFFASELKEAENHGKTLIMASEDPEFEVTLTPVQSGSIEADYRETRKDLRDFIRLAHGIPPAILGIEGGSSLGAGSGLSQAEIYMNRIITPMQRGLHNILDNLVEFGLGIKDHVIRLEAPDIRDLNLDMTRNTQYISHGVFSINEVRHLLGMSDIRNGDLHHIWSRRTSPQVVGGEGSERQPGQGSHTRTESEGGSGGGAVSDMSRA